MSDEKKKADNKSAPASVTPASSKSDTSPPKKSIFVALKEGIVTLGCGIVHDGTVYRKVKVLPAKTSDRKAFGDKKIQHNGAKMTTKLLLGKIAGFPDSPLRNNEQTIRNMIGQDRDQLVFEIRELTKKGRPFIDKFKCQHCNTANSVEVSVEEITETFREMPDESRLRIEKHRCVFDVELPDYGFKGKFCYTDGRLQEVLGNMMTDQMNPFELELEILSRICIEFDGEGPLDRDRWNEMDIDFIDELQGVIESHGYGYDFGPPCRCAECGGETRVRVNPLDFLFQEIRRKSTPRRKRT